MAKFFENEMVKAFVLGMIQQYGPKMVNEAVKDFEYYQKRQREQKKAEADMMVRLGKVLDQVERQINSLDKSTAEIQQTTPRTGRTVISERKVNTGKASISSDDIDRLERCVFQDKRRIGRLVREIKFLESRIEETEEHINGFSSAKNR